ncbi:MAG: DUF1704 domain-containing protein [Planctomycetota bacterium]|nr:DUF1704 domain-containing protein [Planctomycetaceae bacterium]MDQ3329939.1 DUF1704 domain-containing protein [Planctomycetota bacterium]
MPEGNASTVDFEAVTEAVVERLMMNRRVRRNLPGGGRIKIDRQLPFLCLYRRPHDRDDVGTRELVTTEAAYLVASGEERYRDGVSALCEAINGAVQEHFGAFLLIEVWSAQTEAAAAQDAYAPAFRIVTADAEELPTTLRALEKALAAIKINHRRASVTCTIADRVAPPGFEPVVAESACPGCFMLGLEVRPIFRDDTTGTVFPVVLQRLRSRLAVALRQAVFAFTDNGNDPNGHYESLGPTALTRAARQADQELCNIGFAFDFLQQVTPVNSAEAWEEFRSGGFKQAPHFQYRPLPYHPNLLKRRLFDVPIEGIEDSTLAHLCGERQDELDRQLTALRVLGTRNFLYSSLQIYGHAEDGLVELAEQILERLPATPSAEVDDFVTADEVVATAQREIDLYRKRSPEFEGSVVHEDVAAGLMVAKGRLYVSTTVRLRKSRLEPLMHHEVGTHLLTYFNGGRQPFRQLRFGLAGYEPLQEGLAVLAEHLSGGLSRSRLRTLAGRVLAVRWMTEGTGFVETFHRLCGLGFSDRAAFTTTLRVFRGGGLTKDAIYLRGLQQLLAYMADGHDIEPLYVGKIGLHHVPYVRELRRRGVLDPPNVLPRLWDDQHVHDRLDACRTMSILDLAEHAR